MASSCASLISVKLFLLFSLFSIPALSTDFAAGGDGHWSIPSSQDPDYYNKWAAGNRFQVGDSVQFKYAKDSVLYVTASEYDKCRSNHPSFFSNSGKTEFKFNFAGLFYFISGVDGHCERGERMIIKVRPNPNALQSQNGSHSSADVLSLPSVPVFAVGFLGYLLLGF